MTAPGRRARPTPAKPQPDSIYVDFKISPQQAKWAQEYMIDFSPVNAAVRAGYGDRARTMGDVLAEDPYVIGYLDYLVAQQAVRTGVTADRVLQEYARVAFVDPGAIMTWGPGGLRVKASGELSADDRAAITEFTEIVTVGNTMKTTLRVKLANKLEALAVLAKHTRVIRDGPDTLLIDNSKTVNVYAADSILERLKEARASGVTLAEIAAAVMPEPAETVEPEDRQ